MAPKKILIIGFMDSIHVARWLMLFKDENLSFHLYPSGPHRKIHKTIKSLIADHPARYIYRGLPVASNLFFWTLERVLGKSPRRDNLVRIIDTLEPNVIHALEFQNAGYLLSDALNQTTHEPAQVIVTNYGSDLYWFQNSPKHREKISELLRKATHYSAECDRDVRLAQTLGFHGNYKETLPNSGFLNEQDFIDLQVSRCSERKQIAVKGYQGWAGQAITAIKALVLVAPSLSGFTINIFSANLITRIYALMVGRLYKLKFVIHGKKSLSHAQVLKLLENSRIYIGISKTDGISTAALEAMQVGTFPIQSSTSCLGEWIHDGQTGYLVEFTDPIQISERILKALSDDSLVDNASTVNRGIIKAKLSGLEIETKYKKFYQGDSGVTQR